MRFLPSVDLIPRVVGSSSKEGRARSEVLSPTLLPLVEPPVVRVLEQHDPALVVVEQMLGWFESSNEEITVIATPEPLPVEEVRDVPERHGWHPIRAKPHDLRQEIRVVEVDESSFVVLVPHREGLKRIEIANRRAPRLEDDAHRPLARLCGREDLLEGCGLGDEPAVANRDDA